MTMFDIFRKRHEKNTDTNQSNGGMGAYTLSKAQQKEKEMYISMLMGQTSMPTITFDHDWYNMKKIVGNKAIDKKEEQLKELIKEQAALIQKSKQDQAIKQNFMKEVLDVSAQLDQEGDTKDVKTLDNLHQVILKLNQEMEAQELRLDEVSDLIKEVNQDVLKETVSMGYLYMEANKHQSTALEEEIDQLRKQMLEKTKQKKIYDDQMNVLYHYLHKVIGYKHMNEVDKLLGARDD